jgi:threonine dehydrogenase-like Zn-dependent dehydrogenase
VRAAVLEAPCRLFVRDLPPPTPRPGEVVVAVELAGVCGSDVALLTGKRPADYPLILGHEAIGHIVDANATSLSPGQRVVLEPNIPCATCPVCIRGKGNVCAHKRSLGLNAPGVFADLVALPAAFAHALPAGLAPRDAVLIEPLAVALHACSISGVGTGDVVTVVGCGTEGLLLCQVALALGTRVLAADVRADSLSAAERLGVDATYLIEPDEPVERLATRMASDWSPTVVFEAAGAAPAVELAIHAVARGGRVVLVGLTAQTVPVVPLWFVRRGLTLLGSLIYDHPTDFARAIELLNARQLDLAGLVRQVEPLEAVGDALERAANGHTGKVLVDVCAAR